MALGSKSSKESAIYTNKKLTFFFVDSEKSSNFAVAITGKSS